MKTFKQYITEASKNATGIKDISEFSIQEKKYVLSLLSPIELSQLGTPKGGASTKHYVDADTWVRLRDYLIQKSLERSSETPADMCAYTPGETVRLLAHPKIQQWFNLMKNFKVPKSVEKVVFVSCAASKRWGATTKSPDYQCYNMIRKDNPDVYWVTISEPLGIVPQDHWDDFPMYDNPGLFENRGLSTKEWAILFGTEMQYYPFDRKAKDKCISILASVIKQFYDLNKNINPQLRFISAVETPSEKSTHSEMLDVAGILQAEQRHPKKMKVPHGHPTNTIRMDHWRNIASI
jgi:hypothetical protein